MAWADTYLREIILVKQIREDLVYNIVLLRMKCYWGY